MGIKYSDAAKCRQDLIGNMNISDQTVMSKVDFRKMIQTQFNLAKNDPEWNEIWSTLCEKAGISGNSKTMVIDVLFNILGKDAFSPSDEGMSKEMVQESYDNKEIHLKNQKNKRDILVGNQNCLTDVLHLDDIVKILREKIKANFGCLREAYDTLALSNNGYCVTMKNFQGYLKDVLSIRLSDDKMCEFFKLLGGNDENMDEKEVLKKKFSYEQFSKLLGESRLDKAVNVKKIESVQKFQKTGNKGGEPLSFDSKIKAVVTSKFNELLLIFNRRQEGEDEISAEEVCRVLMLYGISAKDAKKAVLGKFKNWEAFMEKNDQFKRKIHESEQTEPKKNLKKLSKKSLTPSTRPSSAASTIFSQKTLTLSQISSVQTGLSQIPEINKNNLNKTNNSHKSIKLHSLILNNWKEISRMVNIENSNNNNSVVTASAVDQALTYDNFIGIFNQYIIKNHDQNNIVPREALAVLYENSDLERIIPCLVLSGILLNRPMNKILLVNKLWTNQLEQVGTKSKVRLQ